MTLVISKKPTLGLGVYSLPDVAQILNLETPLVRRWLVEYWGSKLKGESKVYSSWGSGREKSIHFYTLIEFYVFYQLRKEGVSAQSIVKAHGIISNELNTQYPFASSTLLTDGKKILYTTDNETIINADKSRQINFKSIIEHFCQKIDFGGDKLALRYWPLGKDKNIVIDPHHQLGQPTIKNTNILAETVFRMYTAGEKVPFISSLYDIPEKDVRASIAFFNKAA